MLEQLTMARLRSDASIRAKVKKIETEVADGRISPALAAEQIAEIAAMSESFASSSPASVRFPARPSIRPCRWSNG